MSPSHPLLVYITERLCAGAGEDGDVFTFFVVVVNEQLSEMCKG